MSLFELSPSFIMYSFYFCAIQRLFLSESPFLFLNATCLLSILCSTLSFSTRSGPFPAEQIRSSSSLLQLPFHPFLFLHQAWEFLLVVRICLQGMGQVVPCHLLHGTKEYCFISRVRCYFPFPQTTPSTLCTCSPFPCWRRTDLFRIHPPLGDHVHWGRPWP